MFRTIVFINEQEVNNFKNEYCQADALIIGAEVAPILLQKRNESNPYKDVLEMILANQTPIFVTINNIWLKDDYRGINLIDCSMIQGFFVKNTTTKVLNKLNLKLREIEANHKLAFGDLGLIASIDQIEAVQDASKIAGYARVISLYVDGDAITSSLSIARSSDTKEINYLKERLVIDTALNQKQLIDSPFIGEEVTNLDYLRSIGFGGKAISVPSQIEKINQVFSPSNEEIEASKTILDAQFFGAVQGQKVVVYAGKKLTTEKIQKARNTIRIANRLKLTDYEIPPMVKHKKIKKIKPAPTKFYSLGEEIANAITHGAGVVVGLVALILLMIKGINHPENSRYLVSGIVFGISVILLYLMSTLYHSLPLKRSAKQVFRCFDHASIYVLIAGSYTPFILLLIDGPMAINVAIIMWGLAITGITMKVIWIKKFSKVHLALYIALGWLPVMFFMGNIAALGTIGLGLLIAGGLAYTVGVVFYALKLFKFTHMVWHLFCIIGTLFHFFAVILYL